MTTKQGISTFLAGLDAAGLLDPFKGAPKSLDAHSPEVRQLAKQRIANLWLGLTQDVTDDGIAAAMGAYLRDPKVCSRYPQPGLILARVPGYADPRVDDADEAWGDIKRVVDTLAVTILHGNPDQWTALAPDLDEGDPRQRPGGLVPSLRRLIRSRLEGPPARREAALQALETIGGPRAWLDAANWLGNREPITTARHSFRGAYRSAKPRVLAQAAARAIEGHTRARLEAARPSGANDEGDILAGLPQLRRMDP